MVEGHRLDPVECDASDTPVLHKVRRAPTNLTGIAKNNDGAIRAQLAGADMEEAMDMLALRSAPPEALEARLGVPRVFVEGARSDDPAKYRRLTELVRALSRRVSDSPLLGLVRDPLAADYYLYVDAEDPDLRRPGALESRLELYNYTDQRLWREDLDVADLEDAEQLISSVDQTLVQLEQWLLKGR